MACDAIFSLFVPGLSRDQWCTEGCIQSALPSVFRFANDKSRISVIAVSTEAFPGSKITIQPQGMGDGELTDTELLKLLPWQENIQQNLIMIKKTTQKKKFLGLFSKSTE